MSPTRVATPGPSLYATSCDQVFKDYENCRVAALAGVTFGATPGEYVAITGPSGCGKSTLLNMLAGLDRPTRGQVYCAGVPLDDPRVARVLRSQKIGMVFQAFHLLATLTAVENVQIPMFEAGVSPRQRRARALELLDAVGLGKRADHKPTQLSGGERQRVGIARALANRPQVLLADEPTGNLDSASGDEVLDLFDRLRRESGLTLVVVTHSPEVSRRADRVVRLADGKVVPPAATAS